MVQLDKAVEAPVYRTRQLVAIIGTMALASFIMLLNETVLSVALPAIMQDLSVTALAGQWLTTAYLLTMAVVLPTTGFLLARYQPRALFVFALTMFIIGTLIAMTAVSFPVLVLARIVQAMGTAVSAPLLMTTTLSLIPARRRGTVLGLNSVVIGMAPAIGPTASGLIVQALGWRYIFGLTLPLAAIILLLGILSIRVATPVRPAGVDVLSVLLSVVSFGPIVYAIATIGDPSASKPVTIGIGLAGIVFLTIFARRQISLTGEGRQLLDLRPFGNRTFQLSVFLLITSMGTMLGTVTILPIMLVNGAGFTASEVGLMLLPGGIVQILVAPIFGRLFDRFGSRPLLIPGAILMAAAQWIYASATVDSPLMHYLIANLVLGAGLMMMLSSLLATAVSGVPRELYGHASALFQTAQQLGGAIGTTLFVAILSSAAAGGAKAADAELFAGGHVAFVVGGCIAILGVLIAPFVTSRPRIALTERTP